MSPCRSYLTLYQNYFLWYKGDGSLSLLDISQDLKEYNIKNFFQFDPEVAYVDLISLIADINSREIQIFGVYTLRYAPFVNKVFGQSQGLRNQNVYLLIEICTTTRPAKRN